MNKARKKWTCEIERNEVKTMFWGIIEQIMEAVL